MKELTHEEARALALQHLAGASDHELVIVDRHTIERHWGWVFVYNTREFLETGDHMHALIGNAPLFVDRVDGELWVSGTAHSIEHYLGVSTRRRLWKRIRRRVSAIFGTH